jgi:hypothetical protein
VNDVAYSASDGSFDPTYWDIRQAHHDEFISQQRGPSYAVMQFFFSN